MDILERYRELIEKILSEYAAIPAGYGEIQAEVIFDRHRDRYLLVEVGWENHKRVHDCIVHVDIIDGKIWIQFDGTEEGIAVELTQAGVPKDQIVLGFKPCHLRSYTDYAIV